MGSEQQQNNWTEKVPDIIRRNIFRPVTLAFVLLVLVGQLLIVQHIHHARSPGTIHVHLKQADPNRKNVTLKPLKLDQTKFEIKVLKPHADMKKKFPKHPEMIIKKMRKELDKEVNKTAKIQEEIVLMKKQLGIKNDDSDNRTESATSGTFWTVLGRKKRSLLTAETRLPICPERSPLLVGPLSVKQSGIHDSDPSSDDFKRWFGSRLEVGGASRPEDCTARQKVAIIVPYRDREDHLKVFLHHMHPILQRQQLDYRIVIVEQTKDDDFNRAALMNIGFVEAMKMYDFDCFVFHDVDLLPEDDRNLYLCPKDMAKHMSVAVNKWKYRLQYLNYFGGVTALSTDQFRQINGFSNSFYGWGGEDDDLHHRIKERNFQVFRSPANVARFFMLMHNKVNMNEDLNEMMEKSATNQLKDDGLTTLKYDKIDEQQFQLYTWILAKLPPAPPKKPKGWMSKMGGSLWSGDQ